MSLFKRGDIWHYDFWFLGHRYVGTTRQTGKADAQRLRAGGQAPGASPVGRDRRAAGRAGAHFTGVG